MKIIKDYPPNIDKIRAAFTLHKEIIFTYGSVIYNPHGGHIDVPLMLHEETHCKQQGDDPEGWWDRYLADPDFRIGQELAAYRKQYRALTKLEHDSNVRFRALTHFARSLSGPMYNNVIGFQRAYRLIRKNGGS